MKRALAFLLLVGLSAAASGAPLRMWTSKDGKHSTKAQYVDLRGSSVLLLKEDGRLISVPFAKLSTADNKYIVGQIRADARAEAPAPQPALPAVNQPAIPSKINVVVSEDGGLKARNDQATEDSRKAALRNEQSSVDARATKLNTKRVQMRARGQQIFLEMQQLEQQVAGYRSEIARRHIDLKDATEAGAWEYVQIHQTRIPALRESIANSEERYGQLAAEYASWRSRRRL